MVDDLLAGIGELDDVMASAVAETGSTVVAMRRLKTRGAMGAKRMAEALRDAIVCELTSSTAGVVVAEMCVVCFERRSSR